MPLPSYNLEKSTMMIRENSNRPHKNYFLMERNFRQYNFYKLAAVEIVKFVQKVRFSVSMSEIPKESFAIRSFSCGHCKGS